MLTYSYPANAAETVLMCPHFAKYKMQYKTKHGMLCASTGKQDRLFPTYHQGIY